LHNGGSPMKHISTWMAYWVKKVCDFGLLKIHKCSQRICVLQWGIQYALQFPYGLIVLSFFKWALHSERYLGMMHNSFAPQLITAGLCKMGYHLTQQTLFWISCMTPLAQKWFPTIMLLTVEVNKTQ
jgi:hypothetical protein